MKNGEWYWLFDNYSEWNIKLDKFFMDNVSKDKRIKIFLDIKWTEKNILNLNILRIVNNMSWKDV